MSASTETIERFTQKGYEAGFVTEVEEDRVPPGLNEDVIRQISAKKNEPEWMLEWRLKAYRNWLTMREPDWQYVHYDPIDFQAISYYAAPKRDEDRPESLDDIDPEIKATYDKLGIPLHEQEQLAGVANVAVDAVFDSVSVATSYKEKLAEQGIIFCSMSEAVQNHPELVQKYLGTVIPYNDNYFAGLNSAVFTDGSFVYIPKGVRCPMELSTYFRINAANTGQFERTLIIAEDSSYWKYPSVVMRGDNSVGEFYSVAVTRLRQQADTGTKMTHIGKNTRSTIVSKGISAQEGEQVYRGLVRITPTAENARNYSQCDSMLMGSECGAHTFPYLDVNNSTAQLEHEATTSKIGEDQILYCTSRGISPEDAVSLIVNGFCKEVFRELPMEFAVEAQKLLEVTLEDSVG